MKKSWKALKKSHQFCSMLFVSLGWNFLFFSFVVLSFITLALRKGRNILLFTVQCVKQLLLQWKPIRMCVSTAHYVWYLECLFTRILLGKNSVCVNIFWKEIFSLSFLKVPHCYYRDSNTATKNQFTFTYQENLVKVCVFCSL